jgi:PIF1-like helicase
MKTHTQGLQVPVHVVSLSKLLGCSQGFGGHKASNASQVLEACNNENGELLYPSEYLNSINCPGLPLAHLALKVGCPVMVLQNLNMAGGVFNGTQGILTWIRNRVLEIWLITGEHAGDQIFVPWIKLQPIEGQLAFTLSQLQFSV